MNIRITEHFNAIGVLLALLIIAGLGFFVDFETLKESVLQAGVWAPVLFILLKTLTVVLVPLSGAPLYPVVGAFFGFVPGVMYMVIGDVLGYTIAFFISRKLGLPIVEKIITKDEESMFKRIIDHVGTTKGFLHTILTLGVVPELIAYASGLSSIRYPVFIVAMTLLTLVASSILVGIGAQFGETGILSGGLILPIVVLIVISIGATLFMKSVEKKTPQS